jgi:hypothetical protein
LPRALHNLHEGQYWERFTSFMIQASCLQWVASD